MMKKLLATAVIAASAWTAGPAMADADNVDVLLYTRAGGLFDRFNGVVQEALGDRFGEVVTVDSCVAAVTYLENTENPTLAMWDPETAVGGENPCELPESNFINIFGTADWKYCSLASNTAATLETLLSGDVEIGSHRNPIWMNQSVFYMEEVNPDATVVPYGGSREYLPALNAGEIDFVFSTLIKEEFTCWMTTAPEGYDGMVAAIDYAPDNFWATSGYSASLVGANISDELNAEIMDLVAAAPSYQTQVLDAGYGDSLAVKSRDEQLEFLRTFVSALEANME